ncbi:MAG: penicillin-binding protein 2 [Patescibacteria group bacterium]
MRAKTEDKSLRVISVLFLVIAIGVAVRLFVLQIVEYQYYSTLALNSHEIYKQLFPTRGNIYIQDTRNHTEYPLAINRPYYLLYAVPRDILAGEISSTTNFLANLLQLPPEKKIVIQEKLSKSNDLYETLARKVSDENIDKISSANIKGINYSSQQFRYYPEQNLAANVVGFVGSDVAGNLVGNYGIEGFWEKELAGKSGFLSGEQGALGSWISLAGRTIHHAQDGDSLLLTIDRTLEYKSCERLRQGFEEYKAKSATLIIMEPSTGAILSMCSLPDFDPNNYGQATDLAAYNNTAVFTPYEPGSVFKPIAMAAALDLGVVSPDTTYVDTGERIIDDYKIHNALNKKYGLATMTNVLENSINTGMIFVEEKLGRENFKNYVEKFGFGKETGIELDTETSGDISSFSKRAAIYYANGAFGQGFTATPLQLVTAYAALANNGKLPKPYIVSQIRHADGQVEKTEPRIVENVISPRADQLITGMLTSVVEKTYKNVAKIPGYYIAAKTGTAQIAQGGKYSEATNHTFIGYFPADNPKFVMVVKYEAPDRLWAEQTAAPVFKDIAKFALDYYGIPANR